MNLQKNKSFSKYFLLLLGCIFLIICGVSYALFSETLVGQKDYRIESNGLKVYLDESNQTDSITIQNAIPVTDDEGVKSDAYRFSLVNEETQDLEYTIYLKEDAYENKTPSSAIKYYYTRDVGEIEEIRNITSNQTEDGRYYLETGIIPGKNTYHYEFRMWIDYRAGNEILNTVYSIHLEIDTRQTIDLYKEDILNGTDPVLSSNLIPVTIEDDGTVKKASLFQEWYRYQDKKWANAVVLEDKKQKYNPGDVIPDTNIESYFVWIPRYKYKIFNDEAYTGVTALENRVQTIEVEFENKETPVSNGTVKDEWLSHPAFQAFDTNGFWVGKFETGYKDATTPATAQVNSSDYSKIIVRPNEFSWRNISIGNAFKASYEYLREDESHMMKNTEWGAVALLHHSIYGSRESVRINNNSGYKTGYAAVAEPTLGFSVSSIAGNRYGTDTSITFLYNMPTGYAASTTGNISGIYDMSGGAHEYMMGYNQNASATAENSGLTGIYGDFFTDNRWNKYYDKYSNNSSSVTAYNNRILGDATGEMGPFGDVKDSDGTTRHRSSWYGDYAHFINLSRPWFHRGGSYDYGVVAGIFDFYGHSGDAHVAVTFRLVLSPSNI